MQDRERERFMVQGSARGRLIVQDRERERLLVQDARQGEGEIAGARCKTGRG